MDIFLAVYKNKIISALMMMAILLSSVETTTTLSFAAVIENATSNSKFIPTQVSHPKYSIAPPSLQITYPAYPPTVTVGKIIIQGTAGPGSASRRVFPSPFNLTKLTYLTASESAVRAVSAAAHVFPFNGSFPIKLTAFPIAPKNWSHWAVPLLIKTPGTYRVVVSASNNAGNLSYAVTTINAALPAAKASKEHEPLKLAFVRPTFTEAAYACCQPHGFYTFYFKYKFPPFGKNITSDLDMLTVKTPVSVPEYLNKTGLERLSNFTALVPASYDRDLKKFWVPLTDAVKKDLPNAIVTIMRDEDVDDGHIFNAGNNKSNAYDVLILLHNEYVTQTEYNNLKQYVNNGGKILFIDGDVFYAQVRYDKTNHTISLMKGHDWQFDGKVARRSVPERWYNETKDWVGGNFLVNDLHDKITFTNNPFNYTHFEEQFVNNPKDLILLNYGIKFPKDYLQHEVLPPGKQNGNITVATYALKYGLGRVIMLGVYGQNLVNNKSFMNFINRLITNIAVCHKSCNFSQVYDDRKNFKYTKMA